MRQRAQESWLQWRSHRSKDGLEFYNYPSPLARKYWHYVLCMGQAKCPPGYHHQTHSRDGFLLHYIRQGSLTHRLRGRIHTARQGQVCLMDMSEAILIDNEGATTAHNWWILFNGRDAPHLFTELRADRAPVFDLVDRARFDALFKELLELTRSRPAAYEAKSAASLAGMLAELFAALAKHESHVALVGRRTFLSEPVRKGIDYMTRFHGNAALGLKQICEAAGLSLYHFVRLFRSEVGLSPIQYLNRYRIEQAKQLLANSDKSMEQIARQVGASSQNYFSYLFRKHAGITPREYKAKAMRRQ